MTVSFEVGMVSLRVRGPALMPLCRRPRFVRGEGGVSPFEISFSAGVDFGLPAAKAASDLNGADMGGGAGK